MISSRWRSTAATSSVPVDGLGGAGEPPRLVERLLRVQQRLGRDAGVERAFAADEVLLDDRGLSPRVGQPARADLAGGAGSEDDHVVVQVGHGADATRQLRGARADRMRQRRALMRAASPGTRRASPRSIERAAGGDERGRDGELRPRGGGSSKRSRGRREGAHRSTMFPLGLSHSQDRDQRVRRSRGRRLRCRPAARRSGGGT